MAEISCFEHDPPMKISVQLRNFFFTVVTKKIARSDRCNQRLCSAKFAPNDDGNMIRCDSVPNAMRLLLPGRLMSIVTSPKLTSNPFGMDLHTNSE